MKILSDQVSKHSFPTNGSAENEHSSLSIHSKTIRKGVKNKKRQYVIVPNDKRI